MHRCAFKTVFNVGTEGDDPVPEKEEGLVCPEAAVVLVVLVEFHRVGPAYSFVGDPSCKPFVREQHLLVAGKLIHVQHVCLHFFHRNYRRCSARNVAPVPAVHCVPASETVNVRLPVGKNLQAAVGEVTPVVVCSLVDFRRPEIAAVSCDGGEPFPLPVCQGGVVAVHVRPCRGRFGFYSLVVEYFGIFTIPPFKTEICPCEFPVN